MNPLLITGGSAFIFGGILWALTGTDPLLWAAHAAVMVRSSLIVGGRALAVAARFFAHNLQAEYISTSASLASGVRLQGVPTPASEGLVSRSFPPLANETEVA